MIYIFLSLFLGILFGFIYKNIDVRRINILFMVIVYVLLIIIGINLSSNNEIVSNLASLGFGAFVLTVFSIFGSILFIFFYQKFKKGE